MTARIDLTAETRAWAIEAAGMGVSFDGIAHMLRMSLSTFARIRKDDPEFHAEIMSALADYEISLTMKLSAYVQTGNEKMAKEIRAILAQRFPERHSSDPRMRKSAKATGEGYSDDLEDPERNAPIDASRETLARAVELLLAQDEGKDHA